MRHIIMIRVTEHTLSLFGHTLNLKHDTIVHLVLLEVPNFTTASCFSFLRLVGGATSIGKFGLGVLFAILRGSKIKEEEGENGFIEETVLSLLRIFVHRISYRRKVSILIQLSQHCDYLRLLVVMG